MIAVAPLSSARHAAVLSTAVAFLGMIYELVLAYGLSAVVGGTYQQYALTVGLFTLTLGLGALIFEKRPQWFSSPRRFSLLQFLIAALAGLAAWWTLFLGFSLVPSVDRATLQLILLIPMAAIGIVTGAELPWLMRSHPAQAQSVILGFDFLGMFLATLLFPLLLLPGLGATGIFIAAIGGNIALACLTWNLEPAST